MSANIARIFDTRKKKNQDFRGIVISKIIDIVLAAVFV